MLAFADRTIDTVEDVFMHATRAFMPAAKMNLPLSDDDLNEPPPLSATTKERIVVLGTGWGGHAISKVRMYALVRCADVTDWLIGGVVYMGRIHV